MDRVELSELREQIAGLKAAADVKRSLLRLVEMADAQKNQLANQNTEIESMAARIFEFETLFNEFRINSGTDGLSKDEHSILNKLSKSKSMRLSFADLELFMESGDVLIAADHLEKLGLIGHQANYISWQRYEYWLTVEGASKLKLLKAIDRVGR